jgi:hypothetical protein
MTPTRWLIVLFWVLVGFVLLKQCADSGRKIAQEAGTAPPRQYFFVAPPATKSLPGPAVPSPNADVHQVGFTWKDNTPGQGLYTCQVTLRNDGTKPATGVSVHVRPYRGTMYGTNGEGHVGYRLLKDTDILSQYGSWVSFPDLKPGESSTQSAVFLDQPNATPGYNPNPEIDFGTAK